MVKAVFLGKTYPVQGNWPLEWWLVICNYIGVIGGVAEIIFIR
jgi:hypothetical protein